MRFIGNKSTLLLDIKKVIDENVSQDAQIFCDIFSGTASVARYFKQWYTIYSNDILHFSYVLQKGSIEDNSIPDFSKLKEKTKISDPIDYFNNMNTEQMETIETNRRFFQNTYSPNGGRMYFTDSNALRIDFIRTQIEEWYKNHLIDDTEYYYLLASLIEGIPYISNILGTYGAYHKKWDKRSMKIFQLCPPDIYNNRNENKCFNMNGSNLLEIIQGDILYIDPPYNSRQYLPNYHVLETASRYDFPVVKGISGLRPYQHQKSEFCSKKTALSALKELLMKANFKYILLSYSSDGIMNKDEIENAMKSIGNNSTYRLYKIPYKRYKSRELTKHNNLYEYIFYIEK